MPASPSAAQLTVLMPYGTSAQSNPYLTELVASLRPYCSVVRFSWRQALLGRYDVFHVHWPEYLLRGSTWPRTQVRRALMAMSLLRMQLGRIPIVRTMHNAKPHDAPSSIERLLLAWFDRLTVVGIRINEIDETPEGWVGRTIRHGDYRNWVSSVRVDEAIPGRLVLVGQLRAYKNAPDLINCFRQLPDSEVSLLIAGKPFDAAVKTAIVDAAAGDARVECTLEFLDDQVLATAVSTAELVVLPYAEMGNSGAALLALSCGRPVLVPNTDINQALAAEVGSDWVMTYEGPLTAVALRNAATRAAKLTGEPDLSNRDWADAGPLHVAAYRAAICVRRGQDPASVAT